MPSPGTRPLRLVLDTNVVVSGLLWSGPSRQLLDLAIADSVELFSSQALLEELKHTLGYAKFAGRIEQFGTSVDALVARYSALVTLVTVTAVPRVVRRDADDDQVIAAALAAGAELIVSGDRDLLAVGTYEGMEIVSARKAFESLA